MRQQRDHASRKAPVLSHCPRRSRRRPYEMTKRQELCWRSYEIGTRGYVSTPAATGDGLTGSHVAHIPELDRILAENLLVVCEMGPDGAALRTAHCPSFDVNLLKHRITIGAEGTWKHLDLAYAGRSQQRRRSAPPGFRRATPALAVNVSKGAPHRMHVRIESP